MRGGYQIIDFQKIALSDSNTKVDGVYKAIQDNPLKVLQLNNINLGGTLKDDVFTTATKGTNKYTFDVYDGILTVTSADNVRWVSHDTIQTVISNIDDLQSDVSDLQTETSDIKDMISDAYNAETAYTAGQYCIYNDTLYKCILNTTAGTLPTDTTYWTPTALDDEISAINSDLVKVQKPNTNAYCGFVSDASSVIIPLDSGMINRNTFDADVISSIAIPNVIGLLEYVQACTAYTNSIKITINYDLSSYIGYGAECGFTNVIN